MLEDEVKDMYFPTYFINVCKCCFNWAKYKVKNEKDEDVYLCDKHYHELKSLINKKTILSEK